MALQKRVSELPAVSTVAATDQLIVSSSNATKRCTVQQIGAYFQANGVAGPAGASGAAGSPGASATITIGTVTTGSSASVVNVGTSSAAVLNFTIPAGAAGAQGATGPSGATGAQGSPGQAATIAVGTVTTGAAGSSASVSNVGTSSAAVFNFTIPTGAAGPTGATGATGATGPAGTTSWNGITDKPSTFPPSAHTHTVSAITDFSTAVDAKLTTQTAGVSFAGIQMYDGPGSGPGMHIGYQSIEGVLSVRFNDGNTQTTAWTGTVAAANVTGLAAVATSNSYTDLSSKPTIPTAGTGSTNYCVGNDARLSDARTPLAHTHSASDIASGTLPYARVNFLRGYDGLADADDWMTRVTSNGGSVSTDTSNAVYRFCQGITAHGLRKLLWRVNLLCGTSDASLYAVRTPLYRGPTRSGTQYGNTMDTLTSFSAANYSEAAGLTGNGSSRYLDTGLKPATVGTALHMSVHVTSGGTRSPGTILMGCDNAFDAGWVACSIDYGTSSVGRSNLSASAGPTTPNTMSGAYSIASSSIRSSGAETIVYYNGAWTGRPWSVGNQSMATPTYSTFPDYNIFAFGVNRKGSVAGAVDDTIGAYSIGTHMQPSAIGQYYQTLAAFMTDMGRSI